MLVANADGGFVEVVRNTRVIFKADEGGQCDPFLDSDQGLVAKGAYFTVQDGVACGQHRTDCITFRYDRHRGAVVFHKRVIDVWEMDTQDTPDADADALRLSEHKEIAADPGKPVLLFAYTPATCWRRCAFIRPRVAGSACSAGIMTNVSVRGAPASRSSRRYCTESAQGAQRRRAGNAAKRGADDTQRPRVRSCNRSALV